MNAPALAVAGWTAGWTVPYAPALLAAAAVACAALRSPPAPPPALAACGLGRRRAAPGGARRVRGYRPLLVPLAVVATVAVGPVAPALLVLAGAATSASRRRRAECRRRAALAGGLPEIVDLLLLAVGAGCTVPLAVTAAARWGAGPVAAGLAGATARAERGARLADALDELPRALGEVVRPLTSLLSSAERYGGPVGPALERLAGELRAGERRRAEETARQVPVALLFPLVLCILPAFALLTVAPLLAGALRALRL